VPLLAAHGVVVVYSVADENSFNAVSKWMNQIHSQAPRDVKVLLVGNKIDLADRRVISQEQGPIIRIAVCTEVRGCIFRGVGLHWRKRASDIQFDRRTGHGQSGVEREKSTPFDFAAAK
jgi:GTPase SAR1 family protein